ncbi:hypothetical protein D9758_010322 [Tetrapyrgos nigripes]|uniref:Uncharacterized protein n=1 Tax=Tetrapyrgos nigripes TaxID=182062 RepID=A0A8H5GAA0_9AGAR|nr:hypothetical protein D9758_010322 [Tetrapyrgos nigripes]
MSTLVFPVVVWLGSYLSAPFRMGVGPFDGMRISLSVFYALTWLLRFPVTHSPCNPIPTNATPPIHILSPELPLSIFQLIIITDKSRPSPTQPPISLNHLVNPNFALYSSVNDGKLL